MTDALCGYCHIHPALPGISIIGKPICQPCVDERTAAVQRGEEAEREANRRGLEKEMRWLMEAPGRGSGPTAAAEG
jgi:hypothetical protein